MENKKLLDNSVNYYVYNQSNSEKEIDIFSNEHSEHTGVVKEDNDEYFSSERKEIIGRIRFSKEESMLFDYYLIGDNDNEPKKVMFAKDFSPLQYQSTIIQTINENFELNGLKIRIPLESRDYISVDIVGKSKFKSLGVEEDNKIVNKISDLIPNNQFCVIVDNKSNFPKSIDLLSLFKKEAKLYENDINKGYIETIYKDTDDGSNHFGKCYLNYVISDIEEHKKIFNTLKIISNNTNQISNIINYCYPNNEIEIPIISQAYLSPNQFQSNIIECSYPFTLSKDYSLIVRILPNTKAMYYFYGDGEELKENETPKNFEFSHINKEFQEKLDKQEYFEQEIELENKNDEEKLVKLYGFNNNSHIANWGNDIGVSLNLIKPINKPYFEILKESAYKPFYVKNVEINYEGNNTIKFHKCDANGKKINIPIDFIDSKVITPDMVKYGALQGIDGNTAFSIVMKPKSKLNIKVRGIDAKLDFDTKLN